MPFAYLQGVCFFTLKLGYIIYLSSCFGEYRFILEENMVKLLKYIRPYWKSALLAPLLMLVEVVADLLQPRLLASIVDKGIASGDMEFILRTGALMIGIAILGFLGGLGCIAASSHASLNFGTDLRSALYRKIQSFSFENIDSFQTATLITRLTNDVTQMQNVVMMSLRILVRAPLLAVGGLVMAIGINPGLALIMGVSIPVLIMALSAVIRKGFPLFAKLQQKLDNVNLVMRENLVGVRVVKAFVRGAFERARFANANEELVDVTVSALRLMALTMPLMMLIMNLSIAAVLWFGGIQVRGGAIKVGEIMAFINYMTLILFSLLMVTFVLIMFSRAKASAQRISEVLETRQDIAEIEGASNESVSRGDIAFENVSFRYEGASGDMVLKNISFEIKSGETVAILGSTGSGKSTLVSLIPRLYDVTEGSVTVDGRDVRSMRLAALRGGISFVLQESILFSGTVEENIRWGRQDASMDEVIEAAKTAQAHDFIMNFENGYATLLGQRGVNISGGQKQRISIARALLKKAPILILDDSTSAIDMGTESRLQNALRAMLKDTTTIIIAQRVSSVIDADNIILLEDGEIADQGTHAQLLSRSAIYQDICKSQLGGEACANGE